MALLQIQTLIRAAVEERLRAAAEQILGAVDALLVQHVYGDDALARCHAQVERQRAMLELLLKLKRVKLQPAGTIP